MNKFQKKFDKIANLEILSKSQQDDKHVTSACTIFLRHLALPIDRDLVAKRIPFYSRDFSISDETFVNFFLFVQNFPFSFFLENQPFSHKTANFRFIEPRF